MATAEDSSEMAASSDDSDTRASDLAVLGAGLSVVLSLYEFYIRGNDERGIFIGHWAPTILAFAIYLKDRRNQ